MTDAGRRSGDAVRAAWRLVDDETTYSVFIGPPRRVAVRDEFATVSKADSLQIGAR